MEEPQLKVIVLKFRIKNSKRRFEKKKYGFRHVKKVISREIKEAKDKKIRVIKNKEIGIRKKEKYGNIIKEWER